MSTQSELESAINSAIHDGMTVMDFIKMCADLWEAALDESLRNSRKAFNKAIKGMKEWN